MVQGAGRPGQPNISQPNAGQPNTGQPAMSQPAAGQPVMAQPNGGQPSIFGNGGPSFAQMPSFTPVTRGAPQPAAPQPAPFTASPQPQGFGDPAGHMPAPPAAPQPLAPQAPQPQPQAYGGAQPFTAQPQAPGAAPAPTAPAERPLADFGGVDPGFPDSIFGDVQLGGGLDEPPSLDAAPLGEQPAADTSFADPAGHAGFQAAPSAFEPASMPHQPEAFPGQPDAFGAQPEGYGHQPEAYGTPQPDAYVHQPEAYAQPQPDPYAAQQPQAYAPQPMPAADDPAMYAQPGGQQGVPYGHVPPADPSRALQALDPNYGEPPQVQLGDPHAGMQPAGVEFPDTSGDADFMDASIAHEETGLKSKLMGTLKGRSTVMVASALMGAIALGGALAFAYKQSGGGIDSGDAPIVTADASPVKAVPDAPGGKEFPNKNKLIYDRLTNGSTPGSERLVPRQEDVAVPALPPATATAGLPGAVATTDAAGADGGPRKVKTMVVRPDGSVETPPVPPMPGGAAGMMAQPNMMPVPANQPAAVPQQVAAATPAAATPSSSSAAARVQPRHSHYR
ncbi:MAG: hypothetical protein AAF405_02840 [Pseudomonadota bacterium]